jgi:hypothetical protein
LPTFRTRMYQYVRRSIPEDLNHDVDVRSGNYIHTRIPLNLMYSKSVFGLPWLRRLVAGLSPRRRGFDPGSVQVGFLVDKVALGQVFPRVLRFSPVSFISPVLHYTENGKKLIIFITGLHCGTLHHKRELRISSRNIDLANEIYAECL